MSPHLARFHPAVAAWFQGQLGEPTPAQTDAWPSIAARRHTLLAAPTGSGKTLAAFLAVIDELVREAQQGPLPTETRVLYVSPLKALSNDIQRNLQLPLDGIRTLLAERGEADADIRAWVRTGDTPQAERARMRKQPPHILVTTPESLFILLTSESGRSMLRTVRTVIVDEIHALAGNKRGAHLSLSLARLDALCGNPPVRVGLSATQKPIDTIASFLTGNDSSDCQVIDRGHARQRDLAIEVPDSPLAAVMSNAVWTEIYDRLAVLARSHKTTLVFVNTRRLAERVARFLEERLGASAVAAHHGSLAREHRLEAERRLKQGELKVLVATASLELGIDIGDVDLVCQLGSPRAIATFLQRVGRAGHGVGGISKGRLFPQSRDDLVECTALLDAVRRGELDRIHIPEQPLDVLAQQIVAEVAAVEEVEEAALYACFTRAWPYRQLSRESFTDTVRMLAEGFTTRRGRRSGWLHRDAVNGRLRARRGARLAAMTNAGTIPDQFDYDVILNPQGLKIGTLNEDFSFESLPGDIFQLGNTSYRILKIESGRLLVEDARGQPPNIPFWLGEAPGRSDELSYAVSRLRQTLDEKLAEGVPHALDWLVTELGLSPAAAEQLAGYLGAARAALGALPTQTTLILERFFDEVGDMHLVLHAPFGSAINRAWGLALRKRFCRKFNFELQAAALEDSIVLSLGATHSFPLAEVASYLKADTAREVLIQALLDAPFFGNRWRWNASTALGVLRRRGGRRSPPQFQRSDAEDLLSVIFPDQLACAENLPGLREIPTHPLVTQTLHDCLTETVNVEGLEQVLRRLEASEIRFIARDLTAPSPLAEEVINARAYAHLDDTPPEERRTLAIRQRSHLDPADAASLGQLDVAAIQRVRDEAWPLGSSNPPRSADELHDALVLLGFATTAEIADGLRPLLSELASANRATAATLPNGVEIWLTAERLGELQALFPEAKLTPLIEPVQEPVVADADVALRELLRSRLEGLGPVTEAMLGAPLGLPPAAVAPTLAALEVEGFAIQGHFTQAADSADTAVEWCERRLLARIHRYTLTTLRREIEPVSPQTFMRFLFAWHGLDDPGEGPEAVAAAIEQLEGYPLPAAVWESEVLPARVKGYWPHQLDQLCISGRVAWLRLAPARTVTSTTAPADTEGSRKRRAGPVRQTPIALLLRRHLEHWRRLAPPPEAGELKLSGNAERAREALTRHGAVFFSDLEEISGLLRAQLEEALAELSAAGLVTADTFAGLRALITPAGKRPSLAPQATRRRRRARFDGVDEAGRWSLVRPVGELHSPDTDERTVADTEEIEFMAWTLLNRYGVVFRQLLQRETLLPPWRELLYVYRRLEARGEIRGGRFVDGFSGEQFAHADAVGALRETRKQELDGTTIVLAAADPLNLIDIVVPSGPDARRPAATANNRVLFRDGLPVAFLNAGDVQFASEVDASVQWEMRNQLLRNRLARVAGGLH